VHGSNARKLCIAILISTSRNALFSYYCLYFLFNKIREKGRTGSAWKRGAVDGRGRAVRVKGEKWSKQCMHM
jgi:hypothetical protein